MSGDDRTITINVRALVNELTNPIKQAQASVAGFASTTTGSLAKADAAFEKTAASGTTLSTVMSDISAKSYMAARGLNAAGLESLASALRVTALADAMAQVGRALPGIIAIGAAIGTVTAAARGLQQAVQIAVEVNDALSRIRQALNLQPAAWSAMREQIMQTANQIAVASGTPIDKTMDALAQLIVRTHDVQLSEKALAVSAEVAVATHKDLTSVVGQVVEAVGGYGVMLERLDPRLKSIIQHGGNLEQVLDQLHKDFGHALDDTRDYTRATSMEDAAISTLADHLGNHFIPILGALTEAWDSVKASAISFADDASQIVSGAFSVMEGEIMSVYHALVAVADVLTHNLPAAIGEAKAAWASMKGIGSGARTWWSGVSGLFAPGGHPGFETSGQIEQDAIARTEATAAARSAGAARMTMTRGQTPEQKLAAAELAHRMAMLSEEYSKGRISLDQYDEALNKIARAHKGDAALQERIRSAEEKAALFPPHHSDAAAQHAITDALTNAKSLIEDALLEAQARVDMAKDRADIPTAALESWRKKYGDKPLTANTEAEKARLVTDELRAQQQVRAALLAQQRAEEEAARRYLELARNVPRSDHDRASHVSTLTRSAEQHQRSALEVAAAITRLGATISGLHADLQNLPRQMAEQMAQRQRDVLQTAYDQAEARNKAAQDDVRFQQQLQQLRGGDREEQRSPRYAVQLAQLALAAAQDTIAFYQHALVLDNAIIDAKQRQAKQTEDQKALADAQTALVAATNQLTLAQDQYQESLVQRRNDMLKSIVGKLPGASLNTNEQGGVTGLSFNPYQILLEAFEQSKSYADIMKVVNTIMKVFAQIIDSLRPVIDDLLMILVGVVKVFIDLWNAIAKVLSLLGIHIQQLSILDTETEPLIQIYHDLPTLQQLKSGNKETYQSIYDADDTQLSNMLYSQQLGGGIFGVLGEILAAILALKAIMSLIQGGSVFGGGGGGFFGSIINFIKGLFGGSSGGGGVPSDVYNVDGDFEPTGGPYSAIDETSALKLDWQDINTQSAINPMTVTLDDASMQAVAQSGSDAAAAAADEASGATGGTNALTGITGSVSSVASTATKVLGGIGDVFGIYEGAKEGGVMGGITAGFSADSLALLLGATGPIGIGVGALVGIASLLFGGSNPLIGPKPANEPDIYNTSTWGQDNANLWGAGVGKFANTKMNANGQQFTMNPALAQETGGMGLLQYIAAYIGSAGSSSAKSLLGGLYSDFAGLNTTGTDVKSGKNGILDLANGVQMGYQQLYQAAMQAFKLIQSQGAGVLENLASVATAVTGTLGISTNGLTGSFAAGAVPLTPTALADVLEQTLVPAIEQQTDTLHDDLTDQTDIMNDMSNPGVPVAKGAIAGVSLGVLNNALSLQTLRTRRNRVYQLGGKL